MTVQKINYGTAPDDGTGDPLRVAFKKTDDNFVDLDTRKAEQQDVADALATKVDKVANQRLMTAAEGAKLAGIATGATANSTDAYLLNRANHTGTQAISTVMGLQTALDSKVDKAAGQRLLTDAEGTKLAGIAEQATKNATDAALRDRSTHTGTQPIATVAGLQPALDSKLPASGGVLSGNLTVPSLNGGQLAGMRNKIINGAMEIDQRNNGAAVVDSTGTSPFVVDRWQVVTRSGATITAHRAPSGGGSARRHLSVIINSAKTPAPTDQFRITQGIEGLNVADLWVGTVNAKTVTLSFETCHSVTGTFSGALFNAAFNRSFIFTYTQNAANTWEAKSITIPLDTTGTWAADNTTGLYVSFDYGSGSSLQTATVGSWQAGLFLRSSSATTLVSTAGAIFRLQAVQLEVGSVATPFEHRPYGTELALCQRYYENVGFIALDGVAFANIFYQTTKRAVPTLTKVSGTSTPSVNPRDSVNYFSQDGAVSAARVVYSVSSEL